MHDRIWAPWRAQYLQADSESSKLQKNACFCQAIASNEDRENFLVWRGEHAVVMLNRFPYNNGHLLIAPRTHQGSLGALNGPDLTEPLEAVRMMMGVIDRFMKPQGYNVGLNREAQARTGLPGHLHWHLVPRWDGDTNFMPILANAKVIVESLFEYYDRLVKELGGRGPTAFSEVS